MCFDEVRRSGAWRLTDDVDGVGRFVILSAVVFNFADYALAI